LEGTLTRKRVIAAAIICFACAAPSRAHHGDADRYNQDVITVSGTVVDVQMVNPHARIVFDAMEGGKTVRWQAELGGRNNSSNSSGGRHRRSRRA
jgi:hypothetical protein